MQPVSNTFTPDTVPVYCTCEVRHTTTWCARRVSKLLRRDDVYAQGQLGSAFGSILELIDGQSANCVCFFFFFFFQDLSGFATMIKVEYCTVSPGGGLR
jgi:hypothetical protein